VSRALEVVVDVIGMSIVRRARTGEYSLGFLRDVTHLQTVGFVDDAGYGRIEPLPQAHLSLGVDGAVATTLAPGTEQYMANIGKFGGGVRSPAELDEVFGATVGLKGGVLTGLPPQNANAEHWLIDGSPHRLTDRLRFTFSSATPPALGPMTLNPVTGRVYAVVTSIDRDFATRTEQARQGFPLTEFVLFYRCTPQYGPIPICNPPGHGVRLDPGSPICPAGFLEI
jgi:hypothetical protein